MANNLDIEQRYKGYKDSRDAGCWGAVVLAVIGRVILIFISNWMVVLVLSIVFSVGLLWLAIWGCYNWAKLKNRSGFWALFGIIAPLGFIPLMLLRTKDVRDN